MTSIRYETKKYFFCEDGVTARLLMLLYVYLLYPFDFLVKFKMSAKSAPWSCC